MATHFPESTDTHVEVELPPLPYSYEALEPHIDRVTMMLHHDKHHATYVSNLKKTLEERPKIAHLSLRELLADNLAKVPPDIQTVVRNNAGGHSNHSIFWALMSPEGGGSPRGELEHAIERAFGTLESFKTRFTTAASEHFGSGWAWLVKDRHRKLDIITTANQDSPFMQGRTPVLGVDVWEHAYYLKYQNRRADYLAAWWEVVNWQVAAERFQSAE